MNLERFSALLRQRPRGLRQWLAPVRERLRLIPAVMVLGLVLLAIKGAGLAGGAEAQEQQASQGTASQTSAPDQPQHADNGTDDESGAASSAQVDVLTSLAKRRTELDGRERDLDMRENLIAAAEQRVDGKIDSLKQLQASIQGLLVQRDTAEQKQLDALVKTYSDMRPKDAARIFDSLDETVALSVAAQMKPDVLGAILGAMQSEAAQKLTVRLANRLKLSEAQTAPAQLAAAATPQIAQPAPPVPQTPAAAAPAPEAVPSTAPAASPAARAAPPPAAAPSK